VRLPLAELNLSSNKARGEVDALCSEIKAAADRRCALLRQQLQQQQQVGSLAL